MMREKRTPSLPQLVGWHEAVDLGAEHPNFQQMQRFGWTAEEVRSGDEVKGLVADVYGITPSQVQQFIDHPGKCMGHSCPWFEKAHERWFKHNEERLIRRHKERFAK